MQPNTEFKSSQLLLIGRICEATLSGAKLIHDCTFSVR